MMQQMTGLRGTRRSLAVFLLGSIAASVLAVGTAYAQGQPLKAGEFLDITGGGASAAEAARLGIELAVQEVNQSGGISGRKIDLLTSDTQTDPTVGVGEIKRLVLQQKVELVFGPLISQVLMAALPVMNEAKVPAVGSTGSDQITMQNAPVLFQYADQRELAGKGHGRPGRECAARQIRRDHFGQRSAGKILR